MKTSKKSKRTLDRTGYSLFPLLQPPRKDLKEQPLIVRSFPPPEGSDISQLKPVESVPINSLPN